MKITPQELKIIKQIFTEFLDASKFEVYLFGSRINDTAHKSSDLDVLIRGEQEVPGSILEYLREAFEKSALPYKMDVLEFHRISPAFREKIFKQCFKLEF